MTKTSKAAFIRSHKATIEEANRRIAELKAAGEITPAFSQLMDYTRGNRRVRFNKNLDLETLQRSLAHAKKFIKAKSSTLEGMREIKLTHDTILGDLVKQYGQAGLTSNTTELYRVLGSLQWQRAKSEIASDILVAYVNKKISEGKTANGIKANLTKALKEISEKNVQDATLYVRERWNI